MARCAAVRGQAQIRDQRERGSRTRRWNGNGSAGGSTSRSEEWRRSGRQCERGGKEDRPEKKVKRNCVANKTKLESAAVLAGLTEMMFNFSAADCGALSPFEITPETASRGDRLVTGESRRATALTVLLVYRLT